MNKFKGSKNKAIKSGNPAFKPTKNPLKKKRKGLNKSTIGQAPNN